MIAGGKAEFVYEAYGLKVHSYIELPEIREATSGGATAENSVEVVRGIVPRELTDGERLSSYMAVSKTECLYTFDGVARILVRDGKEIVVDPAADVPHNAIRAYVVGSGLGTMLHQRGALPMHVSALKTPIGIVAFTGHSGAGKSTIAGLLNRKTGWPIISDDMAVLDPAEARPMLKTGAVRMKLWKDAVDRFGATEEAKTRDFARFDKFHVHAPDLFSKDVGELVELLFLQQGDSVRCEEMRDSRRFELVMSSIYRPELVNYFNDKVAVFNKCSKIAEQVKVSTFTREWSATGLTESIDFLADRFSGK